MHHTLLLPLNGVQVRAEVKVLPRKTKKMAKQERRGVQETGQRRRNGITST